jgi:predicted Zn-dependent protease
MKTTPVLVRHSVRLLALLLVITQFAPANVDPKKGRVTDNPTSGNRYTIEQEIQLGRQGVAEVEKQLKLLPPDHPMSKYISKLGQSLAAKAPGYKFPYTFKVVREKSINAFAMPGGPIYVHTGLIQAASESELAAVMGHEISHVVMRHSTRQASRAMKAQIPLAILGGVLGAGVGGWAGALGQMGMSLTAGSVMMKYSRDAETESDVVGAQIMYDAGYNPEAAVTFFTKLKEQSGGSSGPQFLASHPDPGNRARDITKILSRFPAKTYKPMDSSEYLTAKNSLSDLVPETATAQKAPDMRRLRVQNISGQTFKTFQHSAFSIDYPENWQVGGNTSNGVSISPEGGSENGTIAYGVMISGFEPKTRSNELDDALRELMTDIQMTNPGMTLANSPQAFTLNGRSARKLDWIGSSAVQSGKPMRERVRLVAFQGKSRVILYLIFVAPDADFPALWPTFEKMLNSMRVR